MEYLRVLHQHLGGFRHNVVQPESARSTTCHENDGHCGIESKLLKESSRISRQHGTTNRIPPQPSPPWKMGKGLLKRHTDRLSGRNEKLVCQSRKNILLVYVHRDPAQAGSPKGRNAGKSPRAKRNVRPKPSNRMKRASHSGSNMEHIENVLKTPVSAKLSRRNAQKGNTQGFH
jgi:hypothetical protein